jgi:3-oxoadipate enol-lactonase
MTERERRESTVAYEMDADALKPVLVLAHSLGVSCAMWDALMAALRERWRILRFDLPGHGESALPEGPVSVETMAQDVLRLTERLEIGAFSFCGVSLGGLVGQWLGMYAPQRIEHLFLANTARKFGEAAAWNARMELVREHGVAPVVAGTLERWFTAEFRAAQPQTVARIRAMLERCNPAGYVAGCAAVRDADFVDAASGIRARTLVIAGSSDPVSSAAEGKALAEQIAGAEYVELAAAHLSCVERPEEFASAMLSFAARK